MYMHPSNGGDAERERKRGRERARARERERARERDAWIACMHINVVHFMYMYMYLLLFEHIDQAVIFIRFQHAFVCTFIYLLYITRTYARVGLYMHTINMFIYVCMYVLFLDI
jgi:hypothetical protein